MPTPRLHTEAPQLSPVDTLMPSTWRVVLQLVVPMSFTVVHLVCIAVDTQAWRATKMCEAERVCRVPNDAPTDLCSSFWDDLAILMWMYRHAVPAMIVKVVTFVVVVGSHHSTNGPIVASFDMRTLQRGVAGMCMWCTMLALDVTAMVSAVYRYSVLPLKATEYEEQLYPESMDDTGVVLMVVTLIVAMGAAGVSSFAIAVRADDLRQTSQRLEAYHHSPESADDEEVTALLS
jgi:hypothetical protein